MNAYESDYAVVECSWKVQDCVKDRARVREAVLRNLASLPGVVRTYARGERNVKSARL